MFRIGQEEADAASRVITSGALFRIDSKYKEVESFERELKEKMGAAHALSLTSGTAALITSLAALGIGPGDEVIIPAYTFIATASAVLAVGAIPVLCDVDESLTIDPDDVERKLSKNTKAVIPVHIQGFPCNMDKLVALSEKYGFVLVEDACQADGGSYKGRRLGTIGSFGAYSFNYFKIISAGEGGALVTNNLALYERAIIYHDCGSNFWPYAQAITTPSFNGLNYRVSEITGAVLRVQLSRLDGILKDLRSVKSAIMDGCANISGIRFALSNDIEGDCATTLPFIFDKIADAEKFAEAIDGVRPIDTGKHVYTNWPPIMEKRGGHSEASNPYLSLVNKELNMEFTPESCPKTLDILSRTVYMALHCDWNAEEIEEKLTLVKNAVQ